MAHVRGAPCHPQTQGKIERWHQLKNRVCGVLSLRHFRVARWCVLYPLAGGADDFGAAQFDRLGPPAGRVAGSFSGNRRVLFSEVAAFFLASPVLFREIVVFFLANDGARAMARRGRGGCGAAAGAGAGRAPRARRSPCATTGSAIFRPTPPCSLRHFRLARWCVLYPLAGGADDSGAAQFDRLGPPAGRVAGSFSRIRRVLFSEVAALFLASPRSFSRNRRVLFSANDGSGDRRERCELRGRGAQHPDSQRPEDGVVYPTRCGLRAREGVGEPLTSARAIEIASEIGVAFAYSRPAPRPRGGAARIGVSRPTRPSRRCAAPTERLAPAAADSMWDIG